MSVLATEILERFDCLRSERSTWDSLWQDIADHIRPLRAEFTATQPAGGRRGRKIFDSAPADALETFGGGIYGLLTNPANAWFSLKLADPDMARLDGAADWLDGAGRVLRDSFQPGVSRFYAVVPSLYLDWAAFGTGIFYTEDIPGTRRIYDSVRPLAECYLGTDPYEEIDTVYRLVRMTAGAIATRFPRTLPDAVAAALEKGDREARFEVLHAVEPDPRFRPGAIPGRIKPWRSVHLDRASGTVLGTGGFAEFPYQVPRWMVAAGETYGRPKDILADVKMLQEMSRTMLVSAQHAAEPPILAYKENRTSPIRMFPGGITYGAVSAEGRGLIQPFQSGARLDITAELVAQRRDAVRSALFFSLLQLVERPNMTATEVLERQEEKLRLMGPNLGRLQTDFLSPLIKRRFAILQRKGLIPPAPEALQGLPLDIDYVSPLAKAVRMGEAAAISRWLTALEPLAARRPEILDRIDADAVVETLAEGFSIPARVLRSAEQTAAHRLSSVLTAALGQGGGGA